MPGLPGLITQDDSPEHARATAADAVHGYLESLARDGLPTPVEDSHPSVPHIRRP